MAETHFGPNRQPLTKGLAELSLLSNSFMTFERHYSVKMSFSQKEASIRLLPLLVVALGRDIDDVKVRLGLGDFCLSIIMGDIYKYWMFPQLFTDINCRWFVYTWCQLLT